VLELPGWIHFSSGRGIVHGLRRWQNLQRGSHGLRRLRRWPVRKSRWQPKLSGMPSRNVPGVSRQQLLPGMCGGHIQRILGADYVPELRSGNSGP